MRDRFLVWRIAVLLWAHRVLECVDAWAYRAIDDTARELTRRRWQRRLRGRR